MSSVARSVALIILTFGFLLMGRPAASQQKSSTAEKKEPPAAEGKRTLTVALVSSHSQFADVDANFEHFEEFVKNAAAKKARLVCFPELALVSCSDNKKVLEAAEPIPGPSSRKLEALARAQNTYISMGMAEKDGDKYYNTQFLVGPQGYVGKYRKRHPTKGERECGFEPGDAYTVWQIDGFRVGPLICADGRFADTIEAMKQLQVDVIHHPHGNAVGSLGREAEEWSRSKMTYYVPRAAHARAYILIHNSAGDTAGPGGTVTRFSSGALVLDPLGQVVQRTISMERSEKMIVVTVIKPLSQLIPEGELRQLQNR